MIKAEQKLKSPMEAPSNSKLGIEEDGIEMGNWDRSPAPNNNNNYYFYQIQKQRDYHR